MAYDLVVCQQGKTAAATFIKYCINITSTYIGPISLALALLIPLRASHQASNHMVHLEHQLSTSVIEDWIPQKPGGEGDWY